MNTTDQRPIHIFFNRLLEDPNYYSSDESETLENLEHKYLRCSNWNKLPELLLLKPKSIHFAACELDHTSISEIVTMVNTLSKLVNLDYEISVRVGICKNTPFSLVKELRGNVLGIIPKLRDFGIEENIKGLKAQWHGIPYWPRHIIDQLPKSKKSQAIENQLLEIRLTTRQQQIFNLVVERGASNKIIARTLNIGESTVKLHLGHIFKKYGVKNRTQLAVFARK